MLKKIIVSSIIVLSLLQISASKAETRDKEFYKTFDIEGYWSSSVCMYNMSMAYFSPDGFYELRAKEKNRIPNKKMKYSIDADKGTIQIDGKQYFKIISEDTLLETTGMNFNKKCDISKSKADYKELSIALENKKKENLKKSSIYILGTKSISGWGQIPGGIVFKLHSDGVKQLNKIITTKKNKYVAFYAADILVDVIPMNKTLRKDELYFKVSDKMSQKITDALYAETKK